MKYLVILIGFFLFGQSSYGASLVCEFQNMRVIIKKADPKMTGTEKLWVSAASMSGANTLWPMPMLDAKSADGEVCREVKCMRHISFIIGWVRYHAEIASDMNLISGTAGVESEMPYNFGVTCHLIE